MFSAGQAKKTAEDNKNTTSETSQLLNHLEHLIKRAANSGKCSLEKKDTTFSQDRFTTTSVDQVCEELRKNGYKVTLSKNNAMQQIIFEISW
jgi:hypothetical protein